MEHSVSAVITLNGFPTEQFLDTETSYPVPVPVNELLSSMQLLTARTKVRLQKLGGSLPVNLGQEMRGGVGASGDPRNKLALLFQLLLANFAPTNVVIKQCSNCHDQITALTSAPIIVECKHTDAVVCVRAPVSWERLYHFDSKQGVLLRVSKLSTQRCNALCTTK
jgi:hypothetical protein